MYVVTGADDVSALDVNTGAILWTHEANLDPAISVVCCGWTSRGVGLGDGRVYVGQLDGRLVALDQASGAVQWSVQAERWQEGFSITSAPLYFDGLVFTGFAGAEYGIRGRVKAFDASDGSLVWTFYTIPGPGEVGHDTWPQTNDVWQHGGASVWHTPAVDPDLGLLYFSTGNPGPDLNGAVRIGDNLFSSSIVAVDAQSGVYRWHYQQVHHDIWDYDSPSPVVLFDIEIDGRIRHALAQPSKTGWVYVLDRETGEPLIGIDERPVPQDARQATAPTQPYPRGDSFIPQFVAIAPEGFQLINQGRIFTPFWTDPVLMKPGPSGGANWPPSAYDPATGYLYVCATDRAAVYRGGADNEIPADGERYIGGQIWQWPPAGYRHLHGAGHAHQSNRLAAAVARQVLQRFGRDGRRPSVCWPERRTAHRSRLGERGRACGNFRPTRASMRQPPSSSTRGSNTWRCSRRATASPRRPVEIACGCSRSGARLSPCLTPSPKCSRRQPETRSQILPMAQLYFARRAQRAMVRTARAAQVADPHSRIPEAWPTSCRSCGMDATKCQRLGRSSLLSQFEMSAVTSRAHLHGESATRPGLALHGKQNCGRRYWPGRPMQGSARTALPSHPQQ